MKITTIGIDLAKEVFQIHVADDHGEIGYCQVKSNWDDFPPRASISNTK